MEIEILKEDIKAQRKENKYTELKERESEHKQEVKQREEETQGAGERYE